MLETLEDMMWDLNKKIQEQLAKHEYIIIGDMHFEDFALTQVKKNNDIFDIGVFGDVAKEEINAIKENEKESEDLMNFTPHDNYREINLSIQKYLTKSKLKIICWCSESDSETGRCGISIGFKTGPTLCLILITEKDFLFRYFSQQIDSFTP